MSNAMEYIHVFMPDADAITVRINAALRNYRDAEDEKPDRIELGDAERQSLEDWAKDAGIANPGPPRAFAGISIRCVESPQYLAVIGANLTVKVYSLLDGFHVGRLNE